MIDIHCHILPGIDDGPATLAESLAMCRVAADDGIRVIVAAPHRGLAAPAHTTVRQVLDGVKTLARALARQGIPVTVLPGQEIRLEKGMIEEAVRGEALTINRKGKYILIELPSRSVPFYVFDCVARLAEQGMTAIIAHPERNTQIQAGKRVMARLVRAGALAQITGGSLLGEFGPAARRSAVELLKGGLVHLIASDAHSLDRPPVLSQAIAEAGKIVGGKAARAMAEDNAQAVIE